MEWYWILSIMFGIILVFLFSGLPVAFAFVTTNVIIIYFFMGGAGAFSMMVNSGFQMLNNFLLIPLPLFILLGMIVFTSGYGWMMIDALDDFIGKLPARLSIVVIAFGFMFGTVSGVPMGTVAMLGKMFSPIMLKKGYSKLLTLGPICTSGVLTMVNVCSSIGVLLGGLANASIGKILAGLLIPSLFMSILCVIYIIFVAVRHPEQAPKFEPKPITRQKRLQSLGYILPLLFVIFAVVVVVYMGIATPSEAAATGALAMFIVVACFKKLTWTAIKNSMLGAAETTTFVLFIIWGSITFSQILAFTGATTALAQIVTGLDVPTVVTVILMQLVVILLTRFMDLISVTVICTPIFAPVAVALGLDMVWFCCLTVINLGAATLIPPFGMELFTMKGVAPPEVTMGDIIKAAFPFYVVLMIGMAAMIIFPQIIMWIPNMIKF
jgi:tripartite ATP-independent transporter DctM subunit